MKANDVILTVSAIDERGPHYQTLHYRGSGLAMTRTATMPGLDDADGKHGSCQDLTESSALLFVINHSDRCRREGGEWIPGPAFTTWLKHLGQMAGVLREPAPSFAPTQPAALNRGR